MLQGPSIHVFGSANSHEYLRFDLFGNDPHYHCLTPATPSSEFTNRLVPIDPAIVGDLVPWAMNILRHELAPMLQGAGGGDLVDGLDQESVSSALDVVEALAEKAGSTTEDA